METTTATTAADALLLAALSTALKTFNSRDFSQTRELASQVVNAGVARGWAFRSSATQAHWTDEGCELFRSTR